MRQHVSSAGIDPDQDEEVLCVSDIIHNTVSYARSMIFKKEKWERVHKDMVESVDPYLRSIAGRVREANLLSRAQIAAQKGQSG
eukprot:8986191-Karenia_brevis.AAC.1